MRPSAWKSQCPFRAPRTPPRTRVHNDFMLEIKPGGPSADVGDRRGGRAGQDLPGRAPAGPPGDLPGLRGRGPGEAGGPCGGKSPGRVSVARSGTEGRVRVRLQGDQLVGEVEIRQGGGSEPLSDVLDLPPGELGAEAPCEVGSVGRSGRRPLVDRIGPPAESGRAGSAPARAARRRGSTVGRVADSDDRESPPRQASSGRRARARRAYSMIRSRTLSAGTGRIPARIFSRVSSRTFPSGTCGRATTQMTDLTGPWSSWNARVTRSSSKRTRGSWTSGGSWSAKWVTRSSASQALTSWSVKTRLPGRLVADVVAELEALGHEPLGLLRGRHGGAGPSPGKRAGGSARARPGRESERPGAGIRSAQNRAVACWFCALSDLLPGTGKGDGSRTKRTISVEPVGPRSGAARAGLREESNPIGRIRPEILRVNPTGAASSPGRPAIADIVRRTTAPSI